MGRIIVIDMHPIDYQIRKSFGKGNITIKGYSSPEICRGIRSQIPLCHIALFSNRQAFGKHSIVIPGRPRPSCPVSRQQPQQQGPGQQRCSFSSLMDGSALGPVVPGDFRHDDPGAADFAPNDFVDLVHSWKTSPRVNKQKKPLSGPRGPEGGFSSVSK